LARIQSEGKGVNAKNLTAEQEYEKAVGTLNKMTAMGYLMHSFRNPAKTKAVISMDTKKL
jgi:hypothetical protein